MDNRIIQLINTAIQRHHKALADQVSKANLTIHNDHIENVRYAEVIIYLPPGA